MTLIGFCSDMVLAMCARNLWLIAAMFNIGFIFSHIPGVQNSVADLLSRWKQDSEHIKKLSTFIHEPVWVDTHLDLTALNHCI